MVRISGSGGYSPPPKTQEVDPRAGKAPSQAGLQQAQPGAQLDALVDDCVRFRREAAEFLKSVMPNARFESVDAFTRDRELGLFSGSNVTGAERRTGVGGRRPVERPAEPDAGAAPADEGAKAEAKGDAKADAMTAKIPPRGSKEWKAARQKKFEAMMENKNLDPWVVAGRKSEWEARKTMEKEEVFKEMVGDVIEDHIFDGLQRFNESRHATDWEREQFRKTEYRLEDEAHFDRKLDEAADTRRAEVEADAHRDYEMSRMEADIERRTADRMRNRDRDR
ncbi:MAG: hypothetical protein HY791_35270 [Deltaproteobacteria bacterium]|nr:hypothetical protein [Deltaproteobacteria bacterium]